MDTKVPDARPSPFDRAQIQESLERTGESIEKAGVAAAQLRQQLLDSGANDSDVRRELRRLKRRMEKKSRR